MDRERVLAHFRANEAAEAQLEDLFDALEVAEDQQKSVRRLLKELVKEGVLERSSGRVYRVARQEPQERKERVPTPKRRALGTVRRVGRALFIEPSERRAGPVAIAEDPRVSDGDLVEYELDAPASRARTAHGRVLTIIGRPGERPTEIRRLEITHELPARFPVSVEHAASLLGTEVDPKEVARRKDLRHLALVTIDGENARDFDDAVYAEKHGPSSFKVYVAIADVAHYVTAHDAIDREARRRGTSTYLPDRVYPMLPEALSNELCSLKPNVDRLCFVAEMMVGADGNITSTEFYRATMRSRARLTYEQVAAALDGQPDALTRELLPQLVLLYKVAQARLLRRLRRGAIDLDLPEAELIFEDGVPIDSKRRDRNDAHRLIEDLMLLANEAVAAYFESRDLPTLYRIHEEPNPDKLAVFLELCAEVGVEAKLKKGKVRPRDVATLLRELSEHPAGKHLHALLLRTLAQARYAVDNGGHFGLAAEEYLHFTSPIRRYPDLMVHRLLAASLEDQAGTAGKRDAGYSAVALHGIAEECSELERRAALAEREARDLDRAYVAALHIGEPMQGTVTGVQAFGVFVAIDEPYVEGMIPIDQLGDDWFEADPRGAYLVGRRTGTRVSLGMPIEVEIVRVDVELRRVELRPVAALVRAPTGRPRAATVVEGESPLDRLRRVAKERGHGGGFDARKLVKGPSYGKKSREDPKKGRGGGGASAPKKDGAKDPRPPKRGRHKPR